MNKILKELFPEPVVANCLIKQYMGKRLIYAIKYNEHEKPDYIADYGNNTCIEYQYNDNGDIIHKTSRLMVYGLVTEDIISEEIYKYKDDKIAYSKVDERESILSYDARGFISSKLTLTNADPIITSYKTDDLGNIISIKDKESEMIMQYNNEKCIYTKETLADGTICIEELVGYDDSDRVITFYSIDETINIAYHCSTVIVVQTNINHPATIRIVFDYDTDGKLINVESQQFGTKATASSRYIYDDNGLLVKIVDYLNSNKTTERDIIYEKEVN